MPSAAAPHDSSGVARTVHVAAPADVVWRLVSDLPRMGRLSPENVGGRWLGDATGPQVGARFRGTNRRGLRRWSTTVTVTACEPGRRFAFDVASFGLPVSRWSYDVVPVGAGCSVTESWEHRAGWLIQRVGPLVSGVADRRAYTAASIDATLAAVQREAENATAS